MKTINFISQIVGWLSLDNLFLVIFLLILSPSAKADAFCNQLDTPGASNIPGRCPAPNAVGHTGITEDALPFLRQEILSDTDENVRVQDDPAGNLYESRVHSDNSSNKRSILTPVEAAILQGLDFSTEGFDPGFFKVERAGQKEAKGECEVPEPNPAISLLLFGAIGIRLLGRKR